MSFLNLLLAVSILAFVVEGQEDESYNEHFKVETIAFNAFPEVNATAFILFEEDRISRLAFGEFVIVEALLERHTDYIIQYKTVLKEG